MLLNDLYTMHELQPSDDSLSCMVVFRKEHQVFSGQTEKQQAVVPENVLVDMIKELLERELDKNLELGSTRQLKNLAPVTPDMDPEVHITWKETETGYFINAHVKKDVDLFRLNGNFDIV